MDPSRKRNNEPQESSSSEQREGSSNAITSTSAVRDPQKEEISKSTPTSAAPRGPPMLRLRLEDNSTHLKEVDAKGDAVSSNTLTIKSRSRKRNFELIATNDSTQGTSSSLQIAPSSNVPAMLRINNSSEPKRKVAKNSKSITITEVAKEEHPKAAPPPSVPVPERLKRSECPICLEEVGYKGGVCSTKCGHVFCCVCLTQALKLKRQCPMCGKVLRGPTSFHRIYLDI